MSAGSEDFGPYVVYERLGQGGMATVHRAEKRGVGIRRPVALKRLLPHVADDPELVQLFVDEARLASHLRHANVAQTYELGKVDDVFFIAMEYASGPTLTQIIRQCQQAAGEIPLTVTVNILGQVCEALDYAHNLHDDTGRHLRIIHRDVSPANIIVTNTGLVKLIDFGIAKTTLSSVKTQTGFIKGKFGYIAPEYITGQIDARVDLFAVGVIAHEMMAGRRLFDGKDDFETLANIREMNLKPPSYFNPHVTPELDDIVMSALQRDPELRWQSAAALGVALANAGRELGVHVGSAQLVEWVEWAFRQVPRGTDSGGFVPRATPHADTLGIEEVRRPPGDADPDDIDRAFDGVIERFGGNPRPASEETGELTKQITGALTSELGQRRRRLREQREAREARIADDAATPMPTKIRNVGEAMESEETVPFDRVQHAFSDVELLTPPAMAAAEAAAGEMMARAPVRGPATVPRKPAVIARTPAVIARTPAVIARATPPSMDVPAPRVSRPQMDTPLPLPPTPTGPTTMSPPAPPVTRATTETVPPLAAVPPLPAPRGRDSVPPPIPRRSGPSVPPPIPRRSGPTSVPPPIPSSAPRAVVASPRRESSESPGLFDEVLNGSERASAEMAAASGVRDVRDSDEAGAAQAEPRNAKKLANAEKAEKAEKPAKPEKQAKPAKPEKHAKTAKADKPPQTEQTDAAREPRRLRALVWFIVVLVVLGGGAMAIAYYWPDLAALLGIDA